MFVYPCCSWYQYEWFKSGHSMLWWVGYRHHGNIRLCKCCCKWRLLSHSWSSSYELRPTKCIECNQHKQPSNQAAPNSTTNSCNCNPANKWSTGNRQSWMCVCVCVKTTKQQAHSLARRVHLTIMASPSHTSSTLTVAMEATRLKFCECWCAPLKPNNVTYTICVCNV